MELTLAFSPCPNDTFIFDAMVNSRIDCKDFAFNAHLTDIQNLNDLASKGEIDIIKLSYAKYPSVSNNYQLLTSGGALGRGVGPLVISKLKVFPDEVEHTSVAIPGVHTTANLLFTLAYPNVLKKRTILFSDIEEAILAYEADVGVIIHESRFTYQTKGLKLIIDLGEYWEQQTGFPIPLGGIAIRRDLPDDVKRMVNELIKSSVEYALARPSASYPFVSQHAKITDDEVLRNHIELYVNNHTINIGDEGKRAVKELFARAHRAKFCDRIDPSIPIFVDE